MVRIDYNINPPQRYWKCPYCKKEYKFGKVGYLSPRPCSSILSHLKTRHELDLTKRLIELGVIETDGTFYEFKTNICPFCGKKVVQDVFYSYMVLADWVEHLESCPKAELYIKKF